MQVEALKIFCDVARLRSFSRGATENQVTQSTASQTVHQLERHLGVTLIERAHRPLQLTHEGKLFYEGCREIVARYSDLEATVRQRGKEASTVVRMAAIYSVGLGDMSQQTQQFAARHAPARVEVEYLHPDRVYDRVRAGEAEVGIVSFPRPDRELAVTPWRDEEMVLVCHPGHRLARARAVAAGELDGEAFVAFDENLGIRRQTDRFLRQHGVRVQTKLAFDNVEAIKRAVEVASGVALLPFPTLQRELASGALVAVPLRPRDFHRPLGFIHRRGRPFYPSTELFIAQLRNGVTGAGHQDK